MRSKLIRPWRRPKTIQKWMALDLWMALGLAETRQFESYLKVYGTADTWSELLQVVRNNRRRYDELASAIESKAGGKGRSENEA